MEMLGMLMVPKTIAYVAVGFIAYYRYFSNGAVNEDTLNEGGGVVITPMDVETVLVASKQSANEGNKQCWQSDRTAKKGAMRSTHNEIGG